MVKLCLMASHGYPQGPGLVLHQEQGISRVIKDYQPYVSSQGARQEMIRSGSLNLRPNQFGEPWKSKSGLSESDQFVKFEPTVTKPVLIDVQDTRPDSVLFSFGIAEQCTRHEKIFQFLMSRSSEPEGGVLDLFLLSDLMGLQASTSDQQPLAPSLIYPSCEIYDEKPFMDFVGDMAHNSKITIRPDGRVLFTGSGTEMKDFLSVVAEFYLSKNSTKWRKQTVLVPHFNRIDSSEALAIIHGSSVKFEAATVAPLKRDTEARKKEEQKIQRSPEKTKLKPSPKKKNSKKGGRDRDLYRRNYFHACESLLSLMIDKGWRSKTTILSLKKSGPELPDLLTQFSAGIAGTGLAVIFSVICKLACGRVPFCASKVFNTGLGFGLVWLSWAVNKLRDRIVYICKNGSKLGLNEEEMTRQVDKSVKEIYFRAATLMAVAVLRLA